MLEACERSSTMSEIDILKACHNLPARSYNPGEVLIEEGSNGCKLLILESGEVEIVKQDVRINVVSTPGSFFGEVSLLLDKPTMASVRALEPTTVLEVEDGLKFLAENPTANVELSRLLAKRLDGVTNYLVDLKHQFSDHDNHLGMVDEVLESILNLPK